MKLIVIFLIIIATVAAQKLHFYAPSELQTKYPKGVDIRLSPIGYHPTSGQLDGILTIGKPEDGCSPVLNVDNS
jgi:hypothetical protein